MHAIHPIAALLGTLVLLLAGCSSQGTEPPGQGQPLDSQPVRAAGDNRTTAATDMNHPSTPASREIATLGAGCFWCIEAVLERVDGVLDVKSGYMGGTVERPDYDLVCTGATGHAEVVQVTFDPARIGYDELLDWFFKAHDPTTLNRQGNDVGTQYRSAIFCHSPQQEQAARAARERAQPHHRKPIVTEITAATTFWPAEDYHQDFFRRNPNQAYCRAIIPPKLKKLGLDDK